LVTGANGLLGSNIVRELNKRGIPVRILVRESANMKGLEGADFELIKGEILDEQTVDRAVSDCDVVIHAAANTGPVPNRKSYYRPVNVTATGYIVRACMTHGVRRLVHISTSNTIGYGSWAHPADELQPIAPLFRHSGYAATKLEGEQLVLEAVQTNGLNAVILNPTFLIGPGDSKPSSGRILLLYRKEKRAVISRGGKNFVDVRDVAFAACEAIHRGKRGERYLLCNENMTYQEFLSLANEVNGIRQKFVLVPRGLFCAAGLIGSVIEFFHPFFGFNFTFARILSIRNYYTPWKAIKELNLPQTPIRDSIRDAMQWFSAHGYLDRH
jgi:dihydroflavonol-4-reductase